MALLVSGRKKLVHSHTFDSVSGSHLGLRRSTEVLVEDGFEIPNAKNKINNDVNEDMEIIIDVNKQQTVLSTKPSQVSHEGKKSDQFLKYPDFTVEDKENIVDLTEGSSSVISDVNRQQTDTAGVVKSETAPNCSANPESRLDYSVTDNQLSFHTEYFSTVVAADDYDTAATDPFLHFTKLSEKGKEESGGSDIEVVVASLAPIVSEVDHDDIQRVMMLTSSPDSLDPSSVNDTLSEDSRTESEKDLPLE